MHWILFPLDDRPCNSKTPALLADLGGIELKVLPNEIISNLNPIYDFSLAFDWLSSNLLGAEKCILSLDGFLYGGLVRSRKMDVSLNDAHSRLSQLKSLMEVYPNIEFYVSGVLLRLSVTVDETQSEAVWKGIFNYSVLTDKVASGFASPDESFELDHLKSSLPKDVLNEYLECRARNFELNHSLLNLAPYLQRAVFGQEDCSPYGLHRNEKNTLKNEIIKRELHSKFTVLTGADELNCLLLSQAVMDRDGILPTSATLGIFGTDLDALNAISLYEDVTVRENLISHLEFTPFELIENDSKRKIDEWCLIHGFPKGLQNDIFFTKPHPHEAIKNDLRITFDHQKNGSQFSFLDLAYANGADPYFFEILQTMIDLNQIRSFSAWNTTGNRLGTWAAHLSIRHSMDSQNKLNPKKDKLCLWERILDDYAYQGLIRQDLTTLCKKEGLNPWALKERHKEFSEKANQALQLKAQALGCPYPFRASLPWPRLFEIEIQFSL